MTRPNDSPAVAAVLSAARMLQRLEPGPLAELRRMEETRATPMFWRMAARHPDAIGDEKGRRQWIAIVRVLAILTARGDPAKRSALHERGRRLGEVLCDGGDPGWPPPGIRPRPVFSEHRLAQLMAARGPHRAVLLDRAARVLARSRDRRRGIDVVDIAFTLLMPGDGSRLAEPYYRRLDRAERDSDKSGEGE